MRESAEERRAKFKAYDDGLREGRLEAYNEIMRLRKMLHVAYEIIEDAAPHRLKEMNRAALGEGKE